MLYAPPVNSVLLPRTRRKLPSPRVMTLALVWTLLCFTCAARTQHDGQMLLRGAGHCLAAKHFLPYSRATTLKFGYLLDEKSYPGKKVLYVVIYPHPSRQAGLVFAIFLPHDAHQKFNIQNNARFKVSKNSKEVLFITPPIGGTWTQEHLVSAVKRIGKQPELTIPVKSLLAEDSSASCMAYTDPTR